MCHFLFPKVSTFYCILRVTITKWLEICHTSITTITHTSSHCIYCYGCSIALRSHKTKNIK